jgi:hypothetical protein
MLFHHVHSHFDFWSKKFFVALSVSSFEVNSLPNIIQRTHMKYLSILPQEIRQDILSFLPIHTIFSKVTLVDNQWFSTVESLTTLRMIAQREWPSLNAFVTTNNENVDEEMTMKTTKNSNKRVKKSSNMKARKISKTNMNDVVFWKNLIIDRFTRDTLYSYEMIAASKQVIRSENNDRDIDAIEAIYTKMKLLKQLYVFEQSFKDNKYMWFMWDSIVYQRMSKDINHHSDETDYNYSVQATFLDHLFNSHAVCMAYNTTVFSGGDHADTAYCTVIIDKQVTFTLSEEDEEIFEQNEVALTKLYSILHIDPSDADIPSIIQFGLFLNKFVFTDGPLSYNYFFILQEQEASGKKTKKKRAW